MKRFLSNLKFASYFLIAGIIAFAVGLTYLNNTNVESGENVTTGYITSIDKNILHAGRIASSKIVNYPAIVEYRDNTGLVHKMATSVASLSIQKIGSEVKVAYSKTNPATAHEVSESGNIVAYAVIGFGILLFGFGVVAASGVLDKKPPELASQA